MTIKLIAKKLPIIFLFNTLLSIWSTHLFAGMKHEPMVMGVFVDELEIRDAVHDSDQNNALILDMQAWLAYPKSKHCSDQNNALILDMQAWLGKDLNKLLFKMDIERVESENEQVELQALYSKALATYWDLQLGLRKDFKPEPSRNWAVLGVTGLAPYFFEIDSALFIGEEGQAAFRFGVEYDVLFTQKLILTPQLTLNAYAKDDFKIGLGKGLANSETGLRLRYEIKREFAPYVGLTALNNYGNTADYVESLGEKSHEIQYVLGLKFWY